LANIHHLDLDRLHVSSFGWVLCTNRSLEQAQAVEEVVVAAVEGVDGRLLYFGNSA
jgi:hypothetical protein